MNRAIVAFAITVALLAGCSGTSKPKPITTAMPSVSEAAPTRSPSATAPSADTYNGVTLQQLTVAEDIPLPSGLVVYYNISTLGKGGGPGQLRRAYRDVAGRLRIDSLVPPGAARITWQAMDFEHGLAAVEICVEGLCASGENEARPGSEARLVTSDDGGISWSDRGELPADTFVVAIVPGDIIVCTCRRGEPERYWHLPSGDDLVPPAPKLFPQIVEGPGLVWMRQSEDETEMRSWSGEAVSRIGKQRGDRTAPRFLASAVGADLAFRTIWFTRDIPASTGPALGGRFVLANLDQDQHAVAAYYDDIGNLNPAVAISTSRILGNVSTPDNALRRFPAALIDLETRTVHPIPELSPVPNPTLGNTPFVRAALVGNFARVTTGSDCLNVHENAAQSSLTLGCFKDGVLLRLRPEPERTADGATWLAVATPDDGAGWASAECLER